MFPSTPWMSFNKERAFLRHHERINFATRQLKLAKKNLTLEQRWLCNKQILIGCHEKLNFSVKKCWKDKMQGLHNIKCIPLGHTSRFRPFIMVAEICCETRFRRTRSTLCVPIKDEHFLPFYIITKAVLLRKCFEYAHTITGDWIYFESDLDCQSPKQIFNYFHVYR